MMKVRDLTGQRFGRLIALSYEIKISNSGHRNAYWTCQCDCGNKKVIPSSSLVSGCSNSCGCFRKEFIGDTHRKHGMSDTRLYHIFGGMVARCYNPNNKDFKNYGGRGITICPEWLNDKTLFFDWAIENGYTEKLSIDRKENSRGYAPDNCRWTTNTEQARNTRQNVFIKIGTETKTLVEWANKFNIDPSTVWHRIKAGWKRVDAVTKPVKGSGMSLINA